MTNKPAEKAARPRLNTTMGWALSRAAAGCSSGPDGNLADGRPQQRRHGSESLVMESSISNPRDSLGDFSPSVMKELKKMIKEEVAQVAQVVHLKNSEADTPANTPRPSSVSSQKSIFTPSYPAPPPSVVEARSSFKASSPRDQSPGATHAKTAPNTTVPAGQSTPPANSQPKTVRFQSMDSSTTHCQPCTGARSESVSPTAPAVAARVELSSVDKAWGMLFDSEGYSTQRLNSVLRGLANFMVVSGLPDDRLLRLTSFQIAEFGYPETLVVTPDKMLTLYTRYKIEPEKFPYEDIFEARSENALKRIEFLYQDLECPYHLIQAAPRSHPNVPGLTPAGFAKWMVSNILAYPDAEAKRLHAIVSALPVNVDGPLQDGKPERLPRQLSRHLLPGTHDNKVRKILNEAVWDCLEDSTPPLPPTTRTAVAGPSPSQNLARAPEANTHSTRRPSSGGGNPRRPGPVLHRKTYDRGGGSPRRLEPHSARLSRTSSDADASLPRHRDLPNSSVGRLSTVPERQRSPAPANRHNASLPAIPQHHIGSPSPLSQPPSAYDERGSDADYGVYPGHRDGHGSRDESPRSPDIGRRGGAGASVGQGPMREELYVRKGSSGGMVSSIDVGSHHRSSR
ncbi:hypothetical protein CSUB01_00683 [Colletotrichum sublineola]|uniref:DUF7514 domain-containing protein n=1 Tax=Colletotrichum sublineola TaxID=1173701 RepID=A0A066XAN0_COLSU|nr:hypothetical protein CSUB01_00683 [Colletotrichum sublineola]